ncbi:hypothetical protein [Pontibacter beigongshangensis]|uniref:hypothetical protein n=1 Tax=Pontibacter beigongshangensis TaxID=2574733 RepID=UPI00164F7E16|nr:hypothetical protein [Pontibacter beigongshangensis]
MKFLKLPGASLQEDKFEQLCYSSLLQQWLWWQELPGFKAHSENAAAIFLPIILKSKSIHRTCNGFDGCSLPKLPVPSFGGAVAVEAGAAVFIIT